MHKQMMKVSQHKSISAKVLIRFLINSVLTKPSGRARALPPQPPLTHRTAESRGSAKHLCVTNVTGPLLGCFS